MRVRQSRQLGVSLLELMIGIAVGLLVLASGLVIYLSGSRSSTDSLRVNRFNQDLREVMGIMAADIRRAGYASNNAAGAINPFTLATTNLRIVGTDCILYTYDGAGAVATNFFGFRRNGTTVQMLTTNSALAALSDAVCTNNALWVDLTDTNRLTVTGLTFSTAGSRCLSYIRDDYVPTDATTFEVSVAPANSTANACDLATNTPAAAGATRTFTETRQVEITLAAQQTQDATIVRTGPAGRVRETVLVRNNRTLTPP